MLNGRKTSGDVGIQMPAETKLAADQNGTMGGPLVSARPDRNVRRKTDVVHVILRLLCVLASVMALALMTTAKEASTLSIYGFSLPVYSKWSFSQSFEYVVGVSAAVAAYSVLQLFMGSSRLLIRKSPVISSQNHAWFVFAADQALAYVVMSSGSAASGVTNINRTGIKHSALPDFCKPLHGFCDRVAVSIAFAFFSCFLLAASAVLHVIWLSKF